MRAILLAVLCALVLLACKEPAPDMAPVVLGEVIDPGASRWTLSRQQLNGCVEWLKEHQTDWGALRQLSPSPVQSVVFSHSDGARTHLEFFSGRPGWDDTLVIRNFNKDGKLQFSGADGFSESDLNKLKAHLSKSQ